MLSRMAAAPQRRQAAARVVGEIFFYVREVTDLQEWDLCQILPSF